MPFIRSEDGGLVAGEAQEKQTGNAAVLAAARMAMDAPGAVAFSRTGDPTTGRFEGAVVIQSFGEVPSLDQLLSGRYAAHNIGNETRVTRVVLAGLKLVMFDYGCRKLSDLAGRKRRRALYGPGG